MVRRKTATCQQETEGGRASRRSSPSINTNSFNRRAGDAAVALYFMWYNFGRVHHTLRVTLAMEAGVTNHVWSVEEIVALLN